MHYYKFDISAWALHTAHLTPEEEAVYFRLVNFYYDTEQPIPTDTTQVIRRLRLTDYAHIVQEILNEFFDATLDGYRHSRCDKELQVYHAKAEKNREVGKMGGRPPQKKTQTVSETNPPETLTTNYKLETTNYKLEKKKTPIAPPVGVTESVWSDFLTLRKAKKMPVTETALRGIMREADKARITLEIALQVCCENGWGGFKAEWLAGKAVKVSPAQAANLAAARAIFGDERQLTAKTDFVIEGGQVHDATPKIA